MVKGRVMKQKIGTILASASESYWPIVMLSGMFLACSLASSRFGIDVYDEGIALLGAQNVLGGQIPYRDFFYLYPPGGLYLNAALFKVFGPSIIVGRILEALIAFLTVVCVFFVTKRIATQKYATIASILAIVIFILVGSPGISPGINLLIGVLIALLACIYLFHLHTFDKTRDMLVLGLATALLMFFRLDFGLYLFISLSVILLLCNYSGEMSVSAPRKRLRKVVKVWGTYVFGILIIAMPILILVLRVVPLQDLNYQFIVYTRSIYPAFRSLPPPSLLSPPSPGITIAVIEFIMFYFPILIYLSSFGWLCNQAIRHNAKISEQRKPLFLLLLGVLFFVYGSVRVGLGQLVPTALLSVILFLWLVSIFVEKTFQSSEGKAVRAIKSAANLTYVVAIALVLLLLFSFAAVPTLDPAVYLPVGSPASLDLNRARGIYIDADEAHNLTEAVAFIQAHVPSNETIFVGNMQHEQIFINNVMFYFLAERASATKYYDLEPGVATTAMIQNQIINDIVTHDTKYIVLWSGLVANATEPNQSQYPSGVKNLDNFIATNFVPVEHYGDYTIYARKDVV